MASDRAAEADAEEVTAASGGAGLGWRAIRDRLPSKVDGLLVVALVVVGVIARSAGLPHDGLAYDDAWVATGVTKGGLHHLFQVSTNHPGFSGLLVGWSRVTGGRSEALALPPFVVGAVSPALAFVILRRLRAAWPVAFLPAALLVVAPPHVMYSARVKSYVIEAALVLVLALVVPWFARRSWSWRLAAAWVGGALAIGTLSVFALVIVGLATLILVAHPQRDLRRRMVAAGVQGLVQVGYLAAVQSSFDSSTLTDDWDRVYDGYLDVGTSPTALMREVAVHLGRLGQALVDTRTLPALLLVLGALAGLGLRAWRGPDVVAARFLLVLPGVAFIGGAVDQVPFGPSVGNPVFPGGRASLWLLPSLVVGLGFLLHALVERLDRHGVPSWAPSAALVLVALAVVVPQLDDDGPYALGGTRSAHEFVEASTGLRDLIVMLPTGIWPYSAEPRVGVEVVPASDSLNGFSPRFTDPRIWSLGADPWDGTAAGLQRRLGDAPRVAVYNGFIGFGDGGLPALDEALRAAGYRRSASYEREVVLVDIWELVER